MKKNLKNLKIIFGQTRPIQIIGMIAVSGFMAILEALTISLVLPFIVVLTNHSDSSAWRLLETWAERTVPALKDHLLISTGSILLFFFLFKNAFGMCGTSLQLRWVFALKRKCFQRLVKIYSELSFTQLRKYSASHLVQTLGLELNRLFDRLVLGMLIGISEGFVLLAVLSVLFYLNWAAALSCLALIGVTSIVYLKFLSDRVSALGVEHQTAEHDVVKMGFQFFQSIREMLIYQTSETLVSKYVGVQRKLENSIRRYLEFSELPRYLIEVLSIACLLIVCFFLILQNGAREAIPASLGVFAVGLFRILPSLHRIGSSIHSFNFAKPSLNRIARELQDSTTYSATHLPQSIHSPSFKNEIRIEEVTYQYPDTHKNLFQPVTAQIKKGTSCGISGQSGIGKSTLLDILMGLVPPSQGRITIDGIDLKNFNRAWFHLLGLVPQNVSVLEASVMENVTFGRLDFSRSQVIEALEQAKLTEWWKSLPQGLETPLNREEYLSGGQRQRLGLARALVRSPEIIILDEFTSALDEELEQEILETVLTLKNSPTIFLVSHHEKCLKRCDQQLRLISL